MINTVILDIGNVLARFGWQEYLEGMNYTQEQKKRISNATVYSEEWKEWDRSDISREEMADYCCKYDEFTNQEVRRFIEHVYSMVHEYPYAKDFVKVLKENGYKVYLLSNFNGGHYQYCKKDFQFVNYVDGAVISYEVKSIKPEQRIYQCLIEKYHIHPQQAVFLDDMEENCRAASEFGIHTIQVHNQEQVLSDLRKLGVRIS